MLIDLRMLNHPCEPGMNPTWSWCMIFLICCWIQLAKILLINFASIFINDIGPIVFFFGGISAWFWNEGDGGIIECLWKYSFFFNFLKEFKEDGHQFLFICLIEFACEAIWSWTFICRECFYDLFNFISSDWSVQLVCFYLIQLWQAVRF